MKTELIQLYKRNVEGQKGYEYAADSIENENFKNFLEAYARKREKFAEELEEIMDEYGISPRHDTSILGDLHHSFMKLRDKFPGNHDQAILEECARGESLALSDYEKAMKSNQFPSKVLKILMTHRDVILAAERTVRELALVLDGKHQDSELGESHNPSDPPK